MIVCRKRRIAAGSAMKETILVENTYFSYKKKKKDRCNLNTAIFNKSDIVFTYTAFAFLLVFRR